MLLQVFRVFIGVCFCSYVVSTDHVHNRKIPTLHSTLHDVKHRCAFFRSGVSILRPLQQHAPRKNADDSNERDDGDDRSTCADHLQWQVWSVRFALDRLRLRLLLFLCKHLLRGLRAPLRYGLKFQQLHTEGYIL